MKKCIFAAMIIFGISSSFATGVNWSEAKHCDQGYSLMMGHSWAPAHQSIFFQANVSGDALESIENQLGEKINPMIEVTSDRFGHFTGKVGAFNIDIQEIDNNVQFVITDKSGEQLADYIFNSCR